MLGATCSPMLRVVGHPEDGAVGLLAGDLQHQRSERRQQDRRRRDVGDGERVVDPEVLVLDVDRAGPGKRGVEHLEVADAPAVRACRRTDPSMSSTTQWCDGPMPSVEPALADRLGRQRLLRHRDRVPASGSARPPYRSRSGSVTRPINVTAVSASKSSGGCATHTEANPACFRGDRIAPRSCATVSRYRPGSGPTIRPMRTRPVISLFGPCGNCVLNSESRCCRRLQLGNTRRRVLARAPLTCERTEQVR